MMWKDFRGYIWDACYVILVTVILANYWIGFYLGPLSSLPLLSSLTYFMAAIGGAFIYLFMKSVRKAFYATLMMCFLASFITAMAIFLPGILSIVDREVGFYLAVRVAILVFLYTFPFGIGGCMVTAYFYPD